MTLTIYLAGPMSGIDQFNFPAFHSASKDLRKRGFTVISPAEHDESIGFDPTKNSLECFDLHDAMRWDINSILSADAVVVLPGWRSSTGVNIETTVARAIGISILDYPTLLEVRDEPVTDEATRIVYADRQRAYGHPADDFTRTGRMWGAILGLPDIAPHTVGLCMAAVKISRHVNAPKRDNMVDLAGYAATVQLVHEREKETL